MQQPVFSINRLSSLTATLTKHPDVITTIIISCDGLMVSDGLPPEIDERLVAPMAAALSGTGEQLAQNLGFKETRGIIVFGKRQHVLTVSAGPQFILVVIIKASSNISQLLAKARRVAGRIRRKTSEQ